MKGTGSTQELPSKLVLLQTFMRLKVKGKWEEHGTGQSTADCDQEGVVWVLCRWRKCWGEAMGTSN